MTVNNFADFCNALTECGFSMGGGNPKGIFSIIIYDWTNQDAVDSPVKWHTGDPETDPWEWRMRVLEERNDIAYAKLFFRTSGYITKEWYPYFLAVRRNSADFDSAYSDGLFSDAAKRIYGVISENGAAALHEIKQFGGFSAKDKAQFERGITELQMRMYITMCGRAQKVGKNGEPYGWNSTVFTTTEEFCNHCGITVPKLSPEEAYDKIYRQVLKLNPNAEEKTIKKFILG